MPKSKGGFHAARVPAIKEEAKQCDFPWHDVFDAPLLDWLETFSRAHNTVKEIMFAAILPTVSALLGPNTCVKVLETYEEPVNIFLVCLAEPKAGKSQSMRLGCTQPLTTFVEKRVQTELLIQSFTASGMRKHMQTCDGQGIIARDECQRFLKDIIAENKKDSLDATMLVLFHDNSPWFFNSGQERKRKCIEKTGISFLGYSQPNSFLEVYAKMVDRGDGLIDRFLVTVPRANTLSHAEVKLFADKLNNSPVKDLRYIYNQIYAIHHGAQGEVSYTFSLEAEKLFNDHTSSTVAAANAVFNGESQEFIDSKDEKHIIRLSCIIHVLKEAFSNALGTNELSGASAARTGTEGASAARTCTEGASAARTGTGGASAAGVSAARTSTTRASTAVTDDQPPTFVISLSSMRGAIAVTKYFAEQRNILSKVAITTNFKSIVCIFKKTPYA